MRITGLLWEDTTTTEALEDMMAKSKRLGPEIAPWGFKKTWPNGYREPEVRVPVLHEYVYGRPGEYRELYGEPVEWRPNEPFEAVLKLVGQERGRSAARFIWERESDGAHLPMFFHDMLVLCQTSTVTQGRTGSLLWYVAKKGANYGIAAGGGITAP